VGSALSSSACASRPHDARPTPSCTLGSLAKKRSQAVKLRALGCHAPGSRLSGLLGCEAEGIHPARVRRDQFVEDRLNAGFRLGGNGRSF
jgi:hypothetical protein